jgi:hypothetical protein
VSDRELRAALEEAQAELKQARAALAQPLAATALRAEVSDALDRLAQQAHALAPQLEEARLDLQAAHTWAERQKGARADRRLERSPQRMLWLFFCITGALAYPILLLAAPDSVPSWVPIAMGVAAVGLVGWEVGDAWRHRAR